MAGTSSRQLVNFSAPRSFATTFKSKCKETLFPDDPFRQFKNEKPSRRPQKIFQYLVPIFEWLPRYNLKLLRYDILAGITITSLAIPQGISYAKLASIPPIIGLCKLPAAFSFNISILLYRIPIFLLLLSGLP